MNIVPHSKISPKETTEINADEINRLVLRKAVKKSRHHLGIKIIKSKSKFFIRNKEFRYYKSVTAKRCNYKDKQENDGINLSIK